MAIWAEIKKAINSNLDVPLNELINKGVIKSIQRGVTTTSSIAINEVNPEKCLVILNNGHLCYNRSNMDSNAYGSILSSLTSNTLTITTNYLTVSSGTYIGASNISWQVIEFY